MTLGLMLADLIGWSQTEKGAAAREVLERRRVHGLGQGADGTVGLYLCGCDGRLWVYLDRDELSVLVDHALAIGHPDAEMLADYTHTLWNDESEGPAPATE